MAICRVCVTTRTTIPYEFEYDASGLMTAQTDPRGSRHVYEHDALGRVVRDIDPATGSHTFATTNNTGILTVTKTTALGHTTTYDWRSSRDGTSRYTVTLPTGRSNVSNLAVDGSATTTTINGMTVRVTPASDAVFGMFAPAVTTVTTAPNGLVRTTSLTRAASLGGDGTTTLTETRNVTGRASTLNFAGGTRTWTMTSAEGRIARSVLDPLARVVSSATTGTLPTLLSYDDRGRVERITQGTNRFVEIGYDPLSGNLESTTDALARSTLYGSDGVGRVTSITAPDSSITSFTYDGEGHLTSVTPPGRSAHLFGYSPVDLLQDYTAPAAGSSAATLHIEYDRDRRPISITQPDGLQQTFGYQPTTGRLATKTIPGAGTTTLRTTRATV